MIDYLKGHAFAATVISVGLAVVASSIGVFEIASAFHRMLYLVPALLFLLSATVFAGWVPLSFSSRKIRAIGLVAICYEVVLGSLLTSVGSAATAHIPLLSPLGREMIAYGILVWYLSHGYVCVTVKKTQKDRDGTKFLRFFVVSSLIVLIYFLIPLLKYLAYPKDISRFCVGVIFASSYAFGPCAFLWIYYVRMHSSRESKGEALGHP